MIDSNTDDSGFIIFSLNINPNDYKEDLTNLIFNLKPSWSKEGLILKEFSGGLTNKLIGCSNSDDTDATETILCRIYGSGSENYIDREAEIENMKILSSIKLGPRVYCKFDNGICYEYLPGVIVDSKLLLNENIFSKVAQLIAKMHLISITDNDGNDSEGVLFKKIYGLLNLVPADYETKLYGPKDDVDKIPLKHDLEKEVNFMESYIKKFCSRNKSKLVFSHNDLLLANIIYNKPKEEVYFIDFEYSGTNWQAYDIANHFNEYAGVDVVDYKLYPSKEYQIKWLSCYLKAFGRTNDDVDEDLVENFYKEVNKFALVSHLFWGIWSIVQATYPKSELNFANYACIRLGEYFKRKQEFIDL